MFDIQNHASFVIAILVFQAVPGPGTIAILNATARNGVRAGFGAVLGTLLGNAVALRLRAFPCARRLATRLAGIALVGFGLKLAAENR